MKYVRLPAGFVALSIAMHGMMVFLCRLAFVLLGTAVFLIANLPQEIAALGTPSDKLNHAIAFGVLTPIVVIAFPGVPLWRLFIGLMGFNALIELSQGALSLGRQPDFWDWLAGFLAAAGVILMIAAARLIWRSFAEAASGP